MVAIRLNKYVRTGKLFRIRRGIYAKDKNYNRFELATRIYTPSYISFETILTRAGINFQFYSSIFVASYVTRDIWGWRSKDFVYSNERLCLDQYNRHWACEWNRHGRKERAFLDRIYISKDYHFDNLNALDWNKVFEILPIYNNKRMEKKVKQYFDYYKNNQ